MPEIMEGQYTTGLFILNLLELCWLSTQQSNALHNRKAKSEAVKRFRYQETAFQGFKKACSLQPQIIDY